MRAEADLAQARERSNVQTAEAQLEIGVAHLNKADQDVNRLKPLAEAQAVPQQDYDDALARQKAARADLDAKKASLSTTKVTQTADIAQAQAAVAAAKAAMIQAELNIEYCNITSPIDGLIGTRLVTPGNLVGGAEPTLLTTVSSISPMRVLASISESDYLRLRKMRGDRPSGDARLDLLLADGSVYPEKGHISAVDRAIDLRTGTLSVIAEFPNSSGLLRPGQFARVRFPAAVVENAVLAPQKAVTEMQSAQVVYLVGSDNKVQLRSVTLGDRVGENYIITEGLKGGDRIVVEGILKVRPGATVQPMDKPATTEAKPAGKGN
jgi:membrane fusion protein (multidrug efflux system)